MKKIKLNENINKTLHKILNEDSVPTVDNADNVKDAFEAQCKAQFIQDQKKDALLVDIKMPTGIAGALQIPPCPIDIANLMKKFDMTGKFKNINDMTEDPQLTFNHAEDLAMNAFSKLGTVEDNLANKEYQRDKSNSVVSDSYHYAGVYDQINEDNVPVITDNAVIPLVSTIFGKSTAGVGNTVGGAIATGVNVATDFTVATCGTFLLHTATRAAGLFGIAYGLQKCFGHVTGDRTGKFNSNNEELIKGNEKIEDYSSQESDKTWNGKDAIEAINNYMIGLKTSLGNVIAQISPDPGKFSEFEEKINSFISAEDKALAEYLKANNTIAKEAKKEQDAEYQSRIQRKNTKNENVIAFNKNLIDVMVANSADPNFNKIAQQIISVYQECETSNSADKNKKAKEMDVALYDGNIEELKKLAKISESIDYSNKKVLFEASSAVQKPALINAENLYKNVREELSKSMGALFPLGQGEKMQGYEDSKKLMEGMIKSASEEITGKITIICNSYNDGKEEKVPEKIKSFFIHHPMQAKTLNRLWSNHETELNMRMNRRLKQMTDLGNTTRIVGWTAKICRDVIPEIFARLFAFRYVLSVLKEEGYYNFTPARYEEAEQQWNNGEKEDYMISERANMLWILRQIGKQYASVKGDQIYIDTDDKNGFAIKTPMHFASLLLFKMFIIPGTPDTQTTTNLLMNAHRIANADNVNALCAEMNTLVGGITDMDNASTLLTANANIEASKQTIFNTYQEIIKYRANLKVDDINMTAAYQIMSSNKKILSAWMKNKDRVRELYGKIGIDKNSNEAKETIKEIKSILGEFTITDTTQSQPFTEMLKTPDTDKLDYYSYVYSIFQLLKDVYDEYDQLATAPVEDPETIKKICQCTLDFIQLLDSNILMLGDSMTKEDEEANIIRNAIKEYVNRDFNASDKEYQTLFKTLYTYVGGDGDNFDQAYANIGEDVDSSVRESFKDSLINPSKAIAYDFKNNAFFQKAGEGIDFTGFDSINLKGFVKDCDAKSLYDFAIGGPDVYKVDPANASDGIKRLKDAVKYLIEYSICANSNDKVAGEDFVKNFVDAMNKKEYRNVYVMCGGSGKEFDEATNKTQIDVSTLDKALDNPTDALNYSVPTNKVIPSMQDPKQLQLFKGNDSYNFKGFVKDCNATTLKNFIVEEKDKDIQFNDKAAGASFVNILKEAVKYLIDYSIQSNSTGYDNIKELTKITIFNKSIVNYAKDISNTTESLDAAQKKDSTNKNLQATAVFYTNLLDQMNKQFVNLFNNNQNNYKIMFQINNTKTFIYLIDIFKDITDKDSNEQLYAKLEDFELASGKQLLFKDLDNAKKAETVNNICKIFEVINKENTKGTTEAFYLYNAFVHKGYQQEKNK